ncbi:acyl carrier protein [Actinoplanes sp. TBRC 11911]|uniref:acyl carrier protein n=1 Tax=Actinoplanes sp. TBRC 11911 TaxID=2729386 RepID=UPI00145D2C07|nr:acyl carrier protein [Actinoplanes sp. TBRC 11911]NMO50098.1 acyl carrier protein [Actinoplanes sp. TBRC 11911]
MSGHRVDIDDIRRVLIHAIARELEISPDDVRTDVTFTDLGVDSVTMIELVIDLKEAFGRAGLTPSLLAENPTIDATARAVVSLRSPADDEAG